METLTLLELYNVLGDGIAWNAAAKLATFSSAASAEAFAAQTPGWRVQFAYPTQGIEFTRFLGTCTDLELVMMQADARRFNDEPTLAAALLELQRRAR